MSGFSPIMEIKSDQRERSEPAIFMRRHNIYKTTNLRNDKFYWGVHDSIDENDGYLGSGVALRKAIKKYGKENFVRKTMVVYETAEAAYFDEGLIVNRALVNDQMCYNMHPGGKGGDTLSTHPDLMKIGAKISEKLKGHVGARKGKTLSDEEKAILSASHKGCLIWNKGLKTGKRPKEVGMKISASRSGKKYPRIIKKGGPS